MSYSTISNIRVSEKYYVFNKHVYYIKISVQQVWLCLVQSCFVFSFLTT